MRYAGDELELFADARVWKAYVGAHISPFLRGRVLEVGAGIGGTTRFLRGPAVARLVCLEPDPELCARLRASLPRGGSDVDVVEGTIADVGAERFDGIVYVDVLEHVADDRGELRRAASALAPGGALVVMSPAHAWLYSPFDRRIGHHRRYSRETLAAVAPPGLELVALRYLDAVGLFASLANRLLLRQETPTPREIALWDRVLVRASRRVDPLLSHRVGKSILAVWRAP